MPKFTQEEYETIISNNRMFLKAESTKTYSISILFEDDKPVSQFQLLLAVAKYLEFIVKTAIRLSKNYLIIEKKVLEILIDLFSLFVKPNVTKLLYLMFSPFCVTRNFRDFFEELNEAESSEASIPFFNNFDLIFTCYKLDNFGFHYLNQCDFLRNRNLLNKITEGADDKDIPNMRYFLRDLLKVIDLCINRKEFKNLKIELIGPNQSENPYLTMHETNYYDHFAMFKAYGNIFY